MASFAAQLVDMLYDLVERVTGYGTRAQDDKGNNTLGTLKQVLLLS
jgi:hypothetical protein